MPRLKLHLYLKKHLWGAVREWILCVPAMPAVGPGRELQRHSQRDYTQLNSICCVWSTPQRTVNSAVWTSHMCDIPPQTSNVPLFLLFLSKSWSLVFFHLSACLKFPRFKPPCSTFEFSHPFQGSCLECEVNKYLTWGWNNLVAVWGSNIPMIMFPQASRECDRKALGHPFIPTWLPPGEPLWCHQAKVGQVRAGDTEQPWRRNIPSIATSSLWNASLGITEWIGTEMKSDPGPPPTMGRVSFH